MSDQQGFCLDMAGHQQNYIKIVYVCASIGFVYNYIQVN